MRLLRHFVAWVALIVLVAFIGWAIGTPIADGASARHVTHPHVTMAKQTCATGNLILRGEHLTGHPAGAFHPTGLAVIAWQGRWAHPWALMGLGIRQDHPSLIVAYGVYPGRWHVMVGMLTSIWNTQATHVISNVRTITVSQRACA